MKKTLPTFKFEKKLWKKKYLVIGVDEVGRGALAGPLYVGAVCFQNPKLEARNSKQFQNSNDKNRKRFANLNLKNLNLFRNSDLVFRVSEKSNLNIEGFGIDDSKRLSPKQRLFFSKLIKKHALAAEIDRVSVSYINRRGIVKGTQVAMRKVIKRLLNRFNGQKIFLLIDAFYLRNLRGIGLKNQLALVRGDQRSISIAAASIIAKVERDHIMRKLHQKYPVYRWDKNKGYGTKEHIRALKKHGASKLHRDLFLRKII